MGIPLRELQHCNKCNTPEKKIAGNSKKVGKHSCTAMKDSYLCNVDEDERRSAVGREKLLSGLAKFSRCPARKIRTVGIGKNNKH